MKELEVIKPVLIRLLQEKKQVEQKLVEDGIVPKELCSLCDGLTGSKRWIFPLTIDERRDLARFVKWIKEKRIVYVKSESFPSPYATVPVVSVIATRPIGRKKTYEIEEGRYTYEYSLSTFKNRYFGTDALAKFQEIDSCSHFDAYEDEIVRLHKVRKLRMFDGSASVEEKSDALLLCCRKCREEIDKRECESGVGKIGFTYSFSCDLDSILLSKILSETGIAFEVGEVDIFSSHLPFFLGQHRILILDRGRHRELDATVSRLDPKLIVFFGNKSRITELLEFMTSILIVTDAGDFYFYDYTKSIEMSVEKIIDMVVKNLDNYAEETRGNEHYRVVKAFARIGQELGYIPEEEHSKKGVRVDCVWYDRKGKIKVAIEVETRGGWKKDILSTWELEPELSIIVNYLKTDSVPKALTDFALMKALPHKLFYINMETKNGFLFEKQQILKKYSLKPEEKKK